MLTAAKVKARVALDLFFSDLAVFGRTLDDSSKRLIFWLYAAGSVFAFNQGNTGGGVKCVQ